MIEEIQKEYLDNTEHSQKNKEKIADYINEAFVRGGWLAKKINDLKLPGVKGITYRVKSDYSTGAKVRLERGCEWKELSDFIGLTIVAPISTFESLREALKKIRDLDICACFEYTLNCRFMDFPVEIALLDYKTFALKQFDESIKLDCPRLLLDSDEKNKYVKALEELAAIGRIVKGFGRFSICYPSDGTDKPVTVNFEDGFACDSAFSLAFLTGPNYSHLLRFGILTKDDDLRSLAFMAYKGVGDGMSISYMIKYLGTFKS